MFLPWRALNDLRFAFILADSPAKDLLDGGKDAKIFQRTVSRLEEMQSADYLNNIIKQ